ncbi:MAG: hypothetical protein LLG00_08285 [Planctomycetaceae bacterium]|nr:hypothetical protein [Planctomycetaceae bacterium]
MKSLVFVLVFLLVGIVVVGFFQGWFRVSTNNAAQQPNATFTVDEGKIHADAQRAKDKVQGFGPDARVKAGDRAGKTKAPAGVNHGERNN